MPDGTPQDNPLAGYFANKPPSELVQDCKTRELSQWNMLNSRGLPNLWRLAYAQAFGMDPNSGRNATQKLEFCGAQQSFVRFRVNLTRSLIKQRNTLAAGQRIAFQCLAMNDDAASLAQVPICSKIMDYVFREAEGERVCYEALEADGYFGEGFIWSRWNIDGGDMVPVTKQVPVPDKTPGPNFGKPIMMPPKAPGMPPQPLTQPVTQPEKSGAPILQSLYPWNVVRESFARKSPWIVVKEKASKFELMALYPEHAEALKGASLSMSTEGPMGGFAMFGWDASTVTDDMLIVRHFYHESTKAVPGGRYVGYVDDIVLWDLPCPVPSGLPVVSVCSARYFDTLMGYPESADLFSIQEMIDELLSQSATNILKFGNQNLWASDQISFDMDKFMEGGAFFTLPSGVDVPQVVEYAELPEAVKYLLEYLPERMQEIIGSNSVMRGEPKSNISSGAFAALMQNIAEKFVSSTQATFDFAVNATGNVILELVRANAENSFAAEVSGDGNVAYMGYFTRDDLKGVKRVMVNRQSPLMNSIPGRFDVFTQAKSLPKGERWAAVQMLKTGDDSAWTQNDLSDVVYLQWENEQLTQGITTYPDGQDLVSKTDDHFIHSRSHSASLNRLRASPPPEGPNTPQWQTWIAACTAHVNHINGHGVAWMQTMPPFAAMLGLPSPPQFDPAAGSFGLTAPAPPAGMEHDPKSRAPNGPPPPPPQQPQQPGNQPGGGSMPKPAQAAQPAAHQ